MTTTARDFSQFWRQRDAAVFGETNMNCSTPAAVSQTVEHGELTLDAGPEFNQTREHIHDGSTVCWCGTSDHKAIQEVAAKCGFDAEMQSIMDGDDLTREDPRTAEIDPEAELAELTIAVDVLRKQQDEDGYALARAASALKDRDDRLAVATERVAGFERLTATISEAVDAINSAFISHTGKDAVSYLADLRAADAAANCTCGHSKDTHYWKGKEYCCFSDGCDCVRFAASVAVEQVPEESTLCSGVLTFTPSTRDDARMCTCGCVLAVHTRVGVHHVRGCSTHRECTNFTEYKHAA
jgi:hypothetical protein